MEAKLRVLRDFFQYRPIIIYDVGAYEGLWTKMMRRIYPYAIYFQFEANTDKIPFLLPEPYRFTEVLGATDNEPVIYYKTKTANQSGNSVYRENRKYFEDPDQEERKTVTLKTLIETRKLPVPNLIKLDVQGSELDILKGLGPDLLSQVDLLVIELSVQAYNKNAPFAHEIITFLAQQGFVLMDILDTLYSEERVLVQFDALFRRANHPLFAPSLR